LLRRFSDRVSVSIEADLVLNNKRLKGTIENISKDSLFFRVSSSSKDFDFSPGNFFDLEFTVPAGKEIVLKCGVVWSNKDPKNDSTFNLGLEIIESPIEYEDYYKDFYIDTIGLF
jgi:hypothetical protein